MNAEIAGRIRDAFAGAGLSDLPDAIYGQFGDYLELLLRWNRRLNLTAVREPEAIIRRHFVECVFAAQNLPDEIGRLLDYGSGAGFPGIPIAICRPEIAVTVAEAQGKKASFLREVQRRLGIGCEVYQGRVEGMAVESRFDAVTLRAVEKMEVAVPLAAQRAERFLVLLIGAGSAAGYEDLAPGFGRWSRLSLPYMGQSVLLMGQRLYRLREEAE